MVEETKDYIIMTRKRKLGKTTILNELGLTLQALGYTVYVFSLSIHIEYCACGFIQNEDDLFNGLIKGNLVVLLDEGNYNLDLYKKVRKTCNKYNIPVVGFRI